MATTILETTGTLRPDGTLEFDEKVSIPPGRVKVRVESVEVQEPPQENIVEFVERIRREMEAGGSHFMNDEEVAAWIEELREGNGRRIRACQII
jgi:hypothetical protein